MTLAVSRGMTDTRRLMDQRESLVDHMTGHLKVAVMNGKTRGCGSYLPFVVYYEILLHFTVD